MKEPLIIGVDFDPAKLGRSLDDGEPSYDAEFDDADTLLGDLCEILQNQESAKFQVVAFGQDWPVDISTDLLTILTQLNEHISKIDNANFNFCLDFYEQGIERRLVYESDCNDMVRVTCESDTDWVPIPSEIFLDKKVVSICLNKLKDDFVILSKKVCPILSSHEWFTEWVSQGVKH